MELADDKPWNEQQWERYIKRSDARSARFGELLETLHDHPDRDAIIEREMGWNRDVDNVWDDNADEAAFEANDSIQEESGWESSGNSGAEPDDGDDFPAVDGVSFRSVSAYQLAYEVGLEVHRVLRPYMEKLEVDHSDEIGERIQSAYGKSLIPAAKIAGGHGIGYEDHAICGNIVCLRIGLAANQTAVHDITWLGDHRVLSLESASRLTKRLGEVSTAIEERIAELRKRVWWD